MPGPLTARQMLPAIGQDVRCRFESVQVLCTVQDVKVSYGQPRILIQPKAGSGTQWVEMGRLSYWKPLEDGTCLAVTSTAPQGWEHL